MATSAKRVRQTQAPENGRGGGRQRFAASKAGVASIQDENRQALAGEAYAAGCACGATANYYHVQRQAGTKWARLAGKSAAINSLRLRQRWLRWYW
jgi:hypothetical protein